MTTRIDVFTRDDLFVDALAARQGPDGDPLAALLVAYAALADGQLAVSAPASAAPRRRFRRTGWLTTGLAALTVAASGAGMAAAVASTSGPWFAHRAPAGATVAGRQLISNVSARLDALAPFAAQASPIAGERPSLATAGGVMRPTGSGTVTIRVAVAMPAPVGPPVQFGTRVVAAPAPRSASPRMPVPAAPTPPTEPDQTTVAAPAPVTVTTSTSPTPASPTPTSPVVQPPVVQPPAASPGKSAERGGPKGPSAPPGSTANPGANVTAGPGANAKKAATEPEPDATGKRASSPGATDGSNGARGRQP